MNKGNAVDILSSIFEESLSDLIEHYAGDSVNFKRNTKPSSIVACAASVGFSGEQFRGSAILIVSHVSCLSQLGAPKGSETNDWVGELSNQLVGRFKNKVAAYGPLLDMGLPSVICGQNMSYGDGNKVGYWSTFWHDFEISSVLNLAIDESLELELAEEPTIAAEGSLCLF